jgi:pimeloyl-ACP methyl ester carboxylesterase
MMLSGRWWRAKALIRAEAPDAPEQLRATAAERLELLGETGMREYYSFLPEDKQRLYKEISDSMIAASEELRQAEIDFAAYPSNKYELAVRRAREVHKDTDTLFMELTKVLAPEGRFNKAVAEYNTWSKGIIERAKSASGVDLGTDFANFNGTMWAKEYVDAISVEIDKNNKLLTDKRTWDTRLFTQEEIDEQVRQLTLKTEALKEQQKAFVELSKVQDLYKSSSDYAALTPGVTADRVIRSKATVNNAQAMARLEESLKARLSEKLPQNVTGPEVEAYRWRQFEARRDALLSMPAQTIQDLNARLSVLNVEPLSESLELTLPRFADLSVMIDAAMMLKLQEDTENAAGAIKALAQYLGVLRGELAAIPSVDWSELLKDNSPAGLLGALNTAGESLSSRSPLAEAKLLGQKNANENQRKQVFATFQEDRDVNKYLKSLAALSASDTMIEDRLARLRENVKRTLNDLISAAQAADVPVDHTVLSKMEEAELSAFKSYATTLATQSKLREELGVNATSAQITAIEKEMRTAEDSLSKVVNDVLRRNVSADALQNALHSTLGIDISKADAFAGALTSGLNRAGGIVAGLVTDYERQLRKFYEGRGAFPSALSEAMVRVFKSAEVISAAQALATSIGSFTKSAFKSALQGASEVSSVFKGIPEDVFETLPLEDRSTLIMEAQAFKMLPEIEGLELVVADLVKGLQAGTLNSGIDLVNEAMRLLAEKGFQTPAEMMKEASQTMLKGANLIYDSFGGAAAAVVRRAQGGSVWGAGTATSDSIPAMLSNGEFVVRAAQANKYRGLLERINNGNLELNGGGNVWEQAATYARDKGKTPLAGLMTKEHYNPIDLKSLPHFGPQLAALRDRYRAEVVARFGDTPLDKMRLTQLDKALELERRYTQELSELLRISIEKPNKELNLQYRAMGYKQEHAATLSGLFVPETSTVKARELKRNARFSLDAAYAVKTHEIGHSIDMLLKGIVRAQKMDADAISAAVAPIAKVDGYQVADKLGALRTLGGPAGLYTSKHKAGDLSDMTELLQVRTGMQEWLMRAETAANNLGRELLIFESETAKEALRGSHLSYLEGDTDDLIKATGNKTSLGKHGYIGAYAREYDATIKDRVKGAVLLPYLAMQGRIRDMTDPARAMAAPLAVGMPTSYILGLDQYDLMSRLTGNAWYGGLADAVAKVAAESTLGAGLIAAYSMIPPSPYKVAAGGLAALGLAGLTAREYFIRRREEEDKRLLDKTQNFATGGSVWGAGTATSDSIPAMLSNGEFVVRAAQANKYRSLLERMNNGSVGYQQGGTARLKGAGTLDSLVSDALGIDINITVAPTAPQVDQTGRRAIEQALMLNQLQEIRKADYERRFGSEHARYKMGYEQFSPEMLTKGLPVFKDRIEAFLKLMADRETFFKMDLESRNEYTAELGRIIAQQVSLQQAGRDVATTFSSSLQEGISSVFKGKATPKEAFIAIVDKMADSYIDAFISGLLSPLNKEGGIMEKFGDMISSSMAKLFAGNGSAGGSGGLWGALSSMGSGVARMFGFATGGYVSGPGTPTSDSIPAMLSNGEFVINAAATRKFLPLLQAINGGSYGQFSEGGFLGGGLSAGTSFSGYSSLTPVYEGLGALNYQLGGVSSSMTAVGDSLSSYGAMNANVLGAGFNQVGSGLSDMGFFISKGFTAIGLQMVANSKPGKFDWVGVAIAAAGMILPNLNFGSAGAATAGPSAASGMSGSWLGNAPKLPRIGAATGGYITGPGSATSDSIPAMLSNGEFVVRAQQASKFLPILTAINNGHIPAFAEGGPVGNIETLQKATEAKGSSTNNYSISITGDISRQTKREVLQMIDEISAGVNQRNYELGR